MYSVGNVRVAYKKKLNRNVFCIVNFIDPFRKSSVTLVTFFIDIHKVKYNLVNEI